MAIRPWRRMTAGAPGGPAKSRTNVGPRPGSSIRSPGGSDGTSVTASSDRESFRCRVLSVVRPRARGRPTSARRRRPSLPPTGRRKRRDWRSGRESRRPGHPGPPASGRGPPRSSDERRRDRRRRPVRTATSRSAPRHVRSPWRAAAGSAGAAGRSRTEPRRRGQALTRNRSSPRCWAIRCWVANTTTTSWLPCPTKGMTGTPWRSANLTNPVRPSRSTRLRCVQGRMAAGVTTWIHDQRESCVEEPGRVGSARGDGPDPAGQLPGARDREQDVVRHRVQRCLGPALGDPTSQQGPVVRDVHEPGVVAHQHAGAVGGDVLEVPHFGSNHVRARSNTGMRRVTNAGSRWNSPWSSAWSTRSPMASKHGQPMVLLGIAMAFRSKASRSPGRSPTRTPPPEPRSSCTDGGLLIPQGARRPVLRTRVEGHPSTEASEASAPPCRWPEPPWSGPAVEVSDGTPRRARRAG